MTESRIRHLESVGKDARNQAYLDAHAALPEVLGEVKRLTEELADGAAKLEAAEQAEAKAVQRAAAMELALSSIVNGEQPNNANAYNWWIGERKVLRCALHDHAGALADHDAEFERKTFEWCESVIRAGLQGTPISEALKEHDAATAIRARDETLKAVGCWLQGTEPVDRQVWGGALNALVRHDAALVAGYKADAITRQRWYEEEARKLMERHAELVAGRDAEIARLRERADTFEWAVGQKDRQILEFSDALPDLLARAKTEGAAEVLEREARRHGHNHADYEMGNGSARFYNCRACPLLAEAAKLRKADPVALAQSAAQDHTIKPE